MRSQQRILRNINSAVMPSLRRGFIAHAPVSSIATYTSLSQPVRLYAASSSSKRWLTRQMNDHAAKLAEIKGLRSRAGIKLEEINTKFEIFKSGQTVVDLGYAPGSWTQIAVDRTAPDGRVLGIDIIPALPPKGSSSMQGDFTSPRIQEEMKKFLANPLRGRPLKPQITAGEDAGEVKGVVEAAGQTYIEQERAMMKAEEEWAAKTGATERAKDSVDVVLSDMLEPFLMVEGLSKMSLGRPYRLMTTSGNRLRDQVGSIRLCNSALAFTIDVLKPGGSFVCKFYQSGDSPNLKRKFQKVYEEVHVFKPKSSRPESKEVYFVSLKKLADVKKEEIMSMEPTD
ncbi:cell division protein ftsj [Morchella snyderi]|nr:cell division protein ftsj [Morchella snyderi]